MYADIDIDVPDHQKAIEGLSCIGAIILDKDGERKPHVSGVYFQDIPVDPIDGLAAYSTEEASAIGYYKVDILNRRIYDDVKSEDHLIGLMRPDFDWDLFGDEEIVNCLDHVRDHFEIIDMIKPRCVIDLAVAIAIFRPGKVHLIGKSRDIIDAEIWLPSTRYYYKKAHAVAYALSVVVQLNLMIEKANATE